MISTPDARMERTFSDALEGDREAFGRLVASHLATAIGAASLITGTEADGADAVQDALLLAWQRLGQLRDPAVFPAWFRRIVLNCAIRSARRARRMCGIDASALVQPDSLQHALDLRTLRRAMTRLDRRDRILLTLYYYWDLSIAETADLLKVPQGTVKSRVHHSMRRLRAAYQAEERQ